MQKFLIVNTKGFSLEQSILAMHANLQQLHEKEETSLLEIHSVNFVNTFEKPTKTALDISPAANQPVIVYNCCVVLVEPKPKPNMDELIEKAFKQAVEIIYGKPLPSMSVVRDMPDGEKVNIDPIGDQVNEMNDQPTDKEVSELREAASFMKRSEQFSCKHEHLDPVKRYKGHRGSQYYRLCDDCGAEVWHGIDDEHPAPGVGSDEVMKAASEFIKETGDALGKMFISPGEKCPHTHLGDPYHFKDDGGYDYVMRDCKECGKKMFVGVPTQYPELFK
jgi:hypothetical protein